MFLINMIIFSSLQAVYPQNNAIVPTPIFFENAGTLLQPIGVVGMANFVEHLTILLKLEKPNIISLDESCKNMRDCVRIKTLKGKVPEGNVKEIYQKVAKNTNPSKRQTVTRAFSFAYMRLAAKQSRSMKKVIACCTIQKFQKVFRTVQGKS